MLNGYELDEYCCCRNKQQLQQWNLLLLELLLDVTMMF